MTDEHGNEERTGPGEELVPHTGFSGTLAAPDGGVRKFRVTCVDAR